VCAVDATRRGTTGLLAAAAVVSASEKKRVAVRVVVI
jgi:hypothetical protein